MVCCEDALMNVGFRKMAAQIKKLHRDTTVYYVAYNNYRSMKSILLGRYGDAPSVPDEVICEMASPLAQADLVAFSSMTGYAPLTRGLIQRIRKINPDAFIVWGGIHPIIVPEDAIQYADAICTGEGEFAFESFLEAFKKGEDFTTTNNFWFRYKSVQDKEKIIKNSFLPLMTNDQMNALPQLSYGEEEWIYSRKNGGYIPLSRELYIRYNGLGYNTVWSIGCPFKCSYCGNTKFIENDAAYRKIRHPSVQYILDEIKQARTVHHHISNIVFHDDSFMALPMETLSIFAKKYKQQIDLPFAVYGVIPNYVREDKLALLVEAGLNRVRMGIQNGSENILKFYERPTPPQKVLESARIINKFKKFMIPPAYDIILDNPIETREDVVTNLEFIRELPRPFTLNVFSLRVIPNTSLEKKLKMMKISLDEISANYVGVFPSLANCLVFIMAAMPIPDWVFQRWLKKVQPVLSPQKHHPYLLAVCRAVFLVRRFFDHLKFMDFTVITGNKIVYLAWKVGLVKFWQKHILAKFVPSLGSVILPPEVRYQKSDQR